MRPKKRMVALPYRKIESSGVLALAIGHGRPAVVTDLGAVGATVRDFDAGRVVPPEDVPALAAACADLLLDRDALDAAYVGALTARSTLTWREAALSHELAYEAIAGRLDAREHAPAPARPG